MKRSKRIFHLVIEHSLFSKTVKILRIKARYKITNENIKRLSNWIIVHGYLYSPESMDKIPKHLMRG